MRGIGIYRTTPNFPRWWLVLSAICGLADCAIRIASLGYLATNWQLDILRAASMRTKDTP